MPVPEPTPDVCCPMRIKVIVAVIGSVSQERCGIPDSEMAPFIRFDMQAPARPDGQPNKKAVIQFKYCPWCGKAYPPNARLRVVDIQDQLSPDEESGEEWKKGKPPG